MDLGINIQEILDRAKNLPDPVPEPESEPELDTDEYGFNFTNPPVNHKFKIGDLFKIKQNSFCGYYVLSKHNIGDGIDACLLNVFTGSRWRKPEAVKDLSNISKKEFLRIAGSDKSRIITMLDTKDLVSYLARLPAKNNGQPIDDSSDMPF